MKRFLRFLLVFAAVMFASVVQAQFMTTHEVKKKETIYGISRTYGITVEQLMQANPGMNAPGYKLKKGDRINIPVIANGQYQQQVYEPNDVRQRSIRMGVVLPLNVNSNDGKRMLEYYRGVLMACDSLRSEGISVDVYAWNAAEEADMNHLLSKIKDAKCDVIFGPYYEKHVAALSSYCKEHNCLLVVPYSMEIPQIYTNRNIFRVSQPFAEQDLSTVRRFLDWFKDARPIIIDCGDKNSTKGAFTTALRKELDEKRIFYKLSSLATENETLLGAMAQDRTNVVVLNTARLTDVALLFKKLVGIKQLRPGLNVSVFGYTEWLGTINTQQSNFHLYDTYIPTTFFTNLSSPLTIRLLQKYRWNFHQEMLSVLPRFALTGFDHALFFLRGLHKYGKSFDGASGRFGYQAVQTPLKFERIGEGGYQNKAYMFMHFKPDHTIDAINY